MLKDVRVTPGRMRGQPEGKAECKALPQGHMQRTGRRPLQALGPSSAGTLTGLICECVCCVLSRVQLCNPTDCGPLGPPIYGILQARILEWVAISFSISSESSYRIKQRETQPCLVSFPVGTL